MKSKDDFPHESVIVVLTGFAMILMIMCLLALMIGSPALLIYMVLSWNGVI